MKTKYDNFLDKCKTQTVPDQLPIVILLTPHDVETMNLQTTEGKRTGNVAGMPFVVVPFLQQSVTLHADGSTTAIDFGSVTT
jgi:hypothetical protein